MDRHEALGWRCSLSRAGALCKQPLCRSIQGVGRGKDLRKLLEPSSNPPEHFMPEPRSPQACSPEALFGPTYFPSHGAHDLPPA